jgi:hypothetical protein
LRVEDVGVRFVFWREEEDESKRGGFLLYWCFQ